MLQWEKSEGCSISQLLYVPYIQCSWSIMVHHKYQNSISKLQGKRIWLKNHYFLEKDFINYGPFALISDSTLFMNYFSTCRLQEFELIKMEEFMELQRSPTLTQTLFLSDNSRMKGLQYACSHYNYSVLLLPVVKPRPVKSHPDHSSVVLNTSISFLSFLVVSSELLHNMEAQQIT